MAEKEQPRPETAELEIHYIKTADYREAPCDGIIGGFTPNGQRLSLSFYSERGPLPRVVAYSVEMAGGETVNFSEEAAKPSRVEGRQGMIRNVSATYYIDIDAARRIAKWLQTRIAEHEARQ